MNIIKFNKFVNAISDRVSEGKVCFLVGAGISMLPPCNLPSGKELKDLAVSTICNEGGFKKHWYKIKSSKKYEEIVPEIIFQNIYESIFEKLFPFLKVLQNSKPNELHRCLANLCVNNRCPIITTNFDLLIDQFLTPGSPIIHLHGSLENKSEMIVRINQIGKGLEKNIEKQIKKYINNKTLCVLGYSGNDKDVLSTIKSANPKQILWLTHNKQDIAWNNIPELKTQNLSIQVTCGDLANLSKYLSNEDSKKVEKNYQPNLLINKESVLKSWSNDLTRQERLLILSKIFFSIEEYENSAYVAERGLDMPASPNQTVWFLNERASALKIIGEFEKAMELAKLASDFDERKIDIYEKALSFNILGNIYLERDLYEPKKAAVFFRRSLQTIDKFDPENYDTNVRMRINSLEAKALNNFGLSLAVSPFFRNEDALKALKKCLKIKRNIGDIIGQAITYINGSLIHYKEKKFNLAYYWRKKSLALINKYNLEFQKAYLFRRMGSIAYDQGRIKQSIRFLNRAHKIYSKLETAKFGLKLTERILSKVTS